MDTPACAPQCPAGPWEAAPAGPSAPFPFSSVAVSNAPWSRLAPRDFCCFRGGFPDAPGPFLLKICQNRFAAAVERDLEPCPMPTACGAPRTRDRVSRVQSAPGHEQERGSGLDTGTERTPRRPHLRFPGSDSPTFSLLHEEGVQPPKSLSEPCPPHPPPVLGKGQLKFCC